MSDFDFDQSFAHELRKGFPFEFEEADWERLTDRLNAVERSKQRRRRFAIWAFPLAATAALLLMGAGLWRMARRVEALQNELTQVRSAQSVAAFSADTTINHVAVIRYDTIYRTIVMQEGRWREGRLFPNSGSFGQMDLKKEEFALKNQYHHPILLSEEPKRQDLSNGSIPSPPDSLNSQAVQLAPRFLPSERFEALPFLPARNPALSHRMLYNLPEMDLPPVVNASLEKPLANMIHRIRPHNVAIGISAGTMWPQVKGAQSFPGFTGGLAGQVSFGQRLRLTGEFSWSSFWSKIKNGDQDAPLFPIITPPTAQDALAFVSIRQPTLDYALGLRYQFRPERRLQPYLGLAWAGASTLEYTLQYEFHNATSGSETFVELPYTEQNVFRSRWQVGLGAEWRPVKRLAFGGEALWQNSIGGGGLLEGPRLKLKANIFYFL